MSFQPIQTGLINRDEEDRILNLALLTGEHVLIIGKPGTAKSLQADLFFEQVEGEFFKASLTKYSGEEVVFGPIDIPALQRSEYKHNYEGSILSTDYAFIDEIFDASDALLRSLLSVLNERMFVRGKFKVKCPLRTAIATANYSRSSEITEAVMDRFLFQWPIKPLGREHLDQLFRWKRPTFRRKMALKTVRKLEDNFSQLSFASNLRSVFLDICTEQGFSARRTYKAMSVCKAAALMRGGHGVRAEDMLSMRFLVGTDKSFVEEFVKELEERTVLQERITRQMEKLDAIETRFKSVMGDDDDPVHLKREKQIIEEIKSVDPVDDKVRARRDLLRSELQAHYMEGRKALLSDMGLE